ncbi:MAG: hypothetical protein HY595_03740 [Candidatus Omnitrophica bacterium]|nr:hypothetical protein [Candidatus Omnitrophota bacterium]
MVGQARKIIVTRRTWQLVAVTGFAVLITAAQYYPFSVESGLWLGGSLFLMVFGLTYLREERKALHSPHSNLVLNWNLAEAMTLLATLLGYFVFAWIRRLDKILFYGYFHTCTLGWLAGILVGEVLWQHTQLRRLDEVCRQRYWANYKNSIF